MRAVPTATRAGTWSLSNVSAISLYPGKTTCALIGSIAATGAALFQTVDTTTYITFSAEL